MTGCPMNIENQPCEDGVTTLVNLGSGQPVASSIVGNLLNVKTLLAGSNITFGITPDTIEISSSGGGGGVTTLSNNGGFAQVGQAITGSTLNLRTIRGDGSTVVTQNVSDISIFTPTNLSVGSGVAVYSGTVAGVNRFRSFLASGPLQISTASDTYTISIIQNIQNNGGGAPIIQPYSGGVLQAKTIIGSPGITIANNPNTVGINNTMGVVTLGGGIPVLQDILTGNVRGRSLVGTGGVAINESGGLITVSSQAQANVGTGENLFITSGLNNNYRSISSGGNIQITSDPTNIYLRPDVIDTFRYSGQHVLNTYVSGNPDISSMVGFPAGELINCDDTFPASIPTLPNAFVGYITPFTGSIKKVSTYIKFSIPTTITEKINIYASIWRVKQAGNSMQEIWSDVVYSTNSNIAVGDLSQTTYDINIGYVVGWGLYFIFYCRRPDAGGEVNPVEFYSSCSVVTNS